MKSFLAIIVISAIILWIGTGCHMTRIKSFDLDMGGLEIEYWEPPPVIGEQGSIGSDLTVPYTVPVSYPKLMPLARGK